VKFEIICVIRGQFFSKQSRVFIIKTGQEHIGMNKQILIIICSLSLLWIFSCSEETIPVSTGEKPVISQIKVPGFWNINSLRLYKTEVWVNDPQGPKNLRGVYLTVHEVLGNNQVFADSLYDDGAYFNKGDGDVLAGDGVFSNQFPAIAITKNSSQAELIFRFIAIDKQNNVSQEMEMTINFIPNNPPEINQIFAPDSLSYMDEEVIFSITVSDSDGIDDITRAYFEIEDPVRQIIRFGQTLYNDGNFEIHGDLVEGDSIFSARISPDFLVGKKGDYNLIFHVVDNNEEENSREAIQSIYIENYQSEFLNFDIPESMIIPAESGTANIGLMQVEVNDPEGIADIDSVYFYSLKPDSNLAQNGLPFLMVDNGLPFNLDNPLIETGDEVAEDGIYSLSLLVYNGSLPGTYTFSFYIRDWAGNLTGPVKRTIELIEE
jgi:hypothetical protein